MESDWDQFAKTLDERVAVRIAPLENQLNAQQELICKLTQSLEGLIEKLQHKAINRLDLTKVKPESLKGKTDKQVSKTQSSDHDEEKPAESGSEVGSS